MSQESQADVSGSAETPPEKKYLSVRQAAFIGVGAMVGAGIFALLGAAGEVAGAAVWLSFLLAGVVAGLQGYSFAKLGARYPSAGGFLEYVAKSTGNGHFTGITAWLTYMANAIVTAMVAVRAPAPAGNRRIGIMVFLIRKCQFCSGRRTRRWRKRSRSSW